ncbi:NADH:flavin oxidoreductase [Actinosynnema sp. ALI-1.44]|uniref:NADH:flavin oxidoreductase/NADH oxidase family protein n=1 Tax=Actinosynnema sp. ALI-1.44 TaxID=1933779 RepID=UPI00097C7CA7|nr:NADH:flavin oxidoreductase/NADH oxidase family protein [Actinosynnema sp. ALI-1.44]ONI84082.1 NADH:flavin oxidoreductase [Actinosynnema sp. ALI-1.44]
MSPSTPAGIAAPLTLPCGRVLSNRLAKAALSEQLGTRTHAPSDDLYRLYEHWAHSGAGLLVTGNVIVDRTAIAEPHNVAVVDDRDFDRLCRWSDVARAGGAEVWAQINHPGRQVPRHITLRPVAPSAVPMRGVGGAFAKPRELRAAEIEELVGKFATTAAIMVRAGFTGIQIHGAHGYLVSQFLSPLTNVRTDEWGGTAEKRRRFLLEVATAVRAEIGPRTPLSVKLNSADFQRGGFTEDESLDVVAALGELGIDLVEISGGTYETPAVMLGNPVKKKASTRAREAYFLEFAEKARATTRTPLMLTGGFRTLGGMNDALSGGAVDLVGLGRSMVVEPTLPGQLLTGRAEASAVSPKRTGIRMLDGMSELVWYTDQMWRLGRGLAVKPDRHPVRGVLNYLLAGGMHAITRQRRDTAPLPEFTPARATERIG